MPNDNIAHMCIIDVKARLNEIALVKDKIFYVYSEDDLVNSARLYRRPCIGIMYEGMRANPSPERMGLAADLSVAVVVIAEAKDIMLLDRKDSLVLLLDQIRGKMRMVTSPTGHKYRFINEIPLGDVATSLIYMQRWTTAVMLTN